MKNKKDGFTLVEILAVILIIGVVAGSAIASFSSVISKSHENYCKTNVDTIKSMTKEYFDDHKSLKPKTIGEKSEVSLETLINEKYSNEDITDYQGTKCNYKNSKVGIIKTTNSNYEYTYSLDCGECNILGNDNLFKKSNIKPDVKYTPNEGENKDNKDLNIKIELIDNGLTIYSYKYEIFKIENNKEISFGGITNYKKYNGKEINVKLDAQGTYKIRTTVINAAGNKTIKDSGLYKLDYGLNGCEGLVLTSTYMPEDNGIWKDLPTGEWHKGEFKFNITKSGNIYSFDVYMSIDGGGEELIVNRATSDKELNYDKGADGRRSHTYKIRIVGYDEKGNKCDVINRNTNIFTYKQDNIPPRCETSGGNGTENNSNWLNSYSNPNYVKIKGTLIDDAENGSEYVNSGTDTSKNKVEDSNGYATEEGNAVRYLRRDTNAYYSPGTVTDKAGNSTVCDASEWVQIDKTLPSCTVSGENTGTWLNKRAYENGKRVKVKGTCVDNPVLEANGTRNTTMSGCNESGNSLSIYGDDDMDNDISPPDVHDVAGNIAKCTGTERVMIDKTAPSCAVSGENTGTWLNKEAYENGKRVKVKGTCVDNPVSNNYGNNIQSGCNSDGNSELVFGDNDMNENISPPAIHDIAENETTCTGKEKVMVDKNPPTCTNSGDSTTWTRNDRTINYGCNDANGCKDNYKGGSKTFSTNTQTSPISAYTIKDVANNTVICPARTANVYVDKCTESEAEETDWLTSCPYRCASGTRWGTTTYTSTFGDSGFVCSSQIESEDCGGVYYKGYSSCSPSCGTNRTKTHYAYSNEDDDRCPFYDDKVSCSNKSCESQEDDDPDPPESKPVKKNSCNYIGYKDRTGDSLGYKGWPCSCGRYHRTPGYAHYCTDGNGNFKVAKSMGKFTWGCPYLNISRYSTSVTIGGKKYTVVDDSMVSTTCITSHGRTGCGGLSLITIN